MYSCRSKIGKVPMKAITGLLRIAAVVAMANNKGSKISRRAIKTGSLFAGPDLLGLPRSVL
jgi:hypothetical protein